MPAGHSSPPPLRLPDARGGEFILGDHLGQSRIVVVFSPPAAFLDDAAAQHGALDERGLLVLAVAGRDDLIAHGAYATPVHVLRDGSGAARRGWGVAEGQTAYYLIGKDGTIKEARADVPALSEVFGTIDAMPMRRREMREQG
jgi:peroxiredoxin